MSPSLSPFSALLMLLLSAGSSAQPTTQPGQTTEPTTLPSIVGRWKADRVQTQVGAMTMTYDFRSDGRVTVSMAGLDGWNFATSAEGIYQVDGETVVIKRGEKTMKHTFTIDGDTLTIIELAPNGDRFDLKRQLSSRPSTKPR
jgi:hypothetical protein